MKVVKELLGRKKIIHKELASGRWFELSFVEQMANVGADIGRTINWRKKDDLECSQQAFERALELLDFTIADPKNKDRAKELVPLRKILLDYFVFGNKSEHTDELWENYFYHFNYAAALARGR